MTSGNAEYFRWSRVKLKRAHKFIAEVEVGLATYNSSNPYSAEWDFSGAETALRINRKEVDPELLAALGDAVHNMRTALDLMASELVRLNGKNDKDVYFPFAASQNQFPDAIKKKNFHRAGNDAVALLNQFAPYKGGNERLRAIHDLDIEDKHKSILVTQVVPVEDLKIAYPLGAGSNPPVQIFPIEIAHNFLSPPLAGLPLIKTLRELAELINEILNAFANMLESRSTGP